MLRAAALLTLLAAACTPAEERAPDRATADKGVETADRVAPAASPVPGPSKASPPPRVLGPITRAEFESRLEPGAGCHIQVGDDLLLVAVVGDAVAKVDGELVDLAGAGSDYDAVTTSTRFTVGTTAIDIAPDPAVGEGNAADGLSLKPVLVTVSRAGNASQPFGAAWVCGS